MNGGPSGFNNAPVTKTFVIACTIFTIVFGIKGRSKKLGFSYQDDNTVDDLWASDVARVVLSMTPFFRNCAVLSFKSLVMYIRAVDPVGDIIIVLMVQDIFEKLQLWKLVVTNFAFSSTPELMFGLYLLYYFRVFERQIGSNKYSVFVLFSVVTSLVLQALALALLKDPSLSGLTSGPYGLIFSSFVPFYLDIPVSTQFRVSGLRFSDKSFIYLAGLQLFLSSWKRSMVPGICGILAGSLYRLNFLRIRKLKLPDFVVSLFSRMSWPSARNVAPAAPSRNVVGNLPSYAGRQVEANYHPGPANFSAAAAAAAAQLPTREPPEDSIATLVSMGFDRDSARQALIQARNDVNVATNILLEAQSH